MAQVCGDAELDGDVDILDALAAARHDVGLILLSGDGFRLADVDGDLRVAILDSLRIAQISVGLLVPLTCLPAPLPAPVETSEGHFANALVCSQCHSNSPMATAMRDELGQPIAPFDLWQSSMMANAARDPFWRAQVSAEMASTPSQATAIGQKCMKCHGVMASTEAALQGEPRPTPLLVGEDTPRGQLALDGVSCTLCHQIQPDLLGTPASYSAGFVIDSSAEIYGPHTGVLSFAMEVTSGYLPVYANHILDSGLCGSCHTLFTDTLDASGATTGDVMPEQMPYLEWRNSAYNNEIPMPGPMAASCQDCHSPLTSDQGLPVMTAIARTPMGDDYGIPDRAPYGRHVFVGGNTLMPAILRDNAANLGTLAPAAAFDATIQLARAQLGTLTANLNLGTITRMADDLQIPITVENLAGHKFPSGYPARRAWIRLRVQDAMGATVFISGDHDLQGRILDGAAALQLFETVGGPIEPHHTLISDPDDVQVYETIMEDTGGSPTFLLMRAAHYQKDNRLLPLGWSPLHPDLASIAPAGVGADGDYASAAGQDSLVYSVTAPAAAGPYTIEATLFYEPISSRTVAELLQVRTSETIAFGHYYQAADRSPEVVAQNSAVAF